MNLLHKELSSWLVCLINNSIHIIRSRIFCYWASHYDRRWSPLGWNRLGCLWTWPLEPNPCQFLPKLIIKFVKDSRVWQPINPIRVFPTLQVVFFWDLRLRTAWRMIFFFPLFHLPAARYFLFSCESLEFAISFQNVLNQFINLLLGIVELCFLFDLSIDLWSIHSNHSLVCINTALIARITIVAALKMQNFPHTWNLKLRLQ